VAASFTVFFGTIFPLLSEVVRGVKVSVGAPFFNLVNIPIFLSLIFLMGIGPLIAWRRASWDNLKRNFLWPLASGILGAAFLFLLGVRPALAVLSLALLLFVAATITLDFFRGTRARVQTGDALFPAMGKLLLRQNHRYGGFVVHLGILVIAFGVTGSHAWSLKTEATLQRGESLDIGRYQIRFDGLAPSEESNHFRVTGTFTVSNNGHAVAVMHPAQKFYPREQTPIAQVDYRSGLVEDLYLVLGSFERDGTQATINAQVTRFVTWIWIGGLILTLGTALAVLTETRRR
ncbi:MAG: cytochrome c-type biogenesis CcmF C-terminal domain-containing protein, partial [Nitrospinota bacterium]